MKTEKDLKQLVQLKYSEIASQDRATNQASCCGAGGCSTELYNIMTDDYGEVKGYQEQADLGLGCGIPTEFANIQKGNTILDLGSGAGNDCFIAAHETGPNGKVIGVDFSQSMLEKARYNAETLKFNQVEFREGDIEHLPVDANSIDVVLSNCVLNLVPNKQQVFSEIFRVLKPGGHFCISDIVLLGNLPQALQQDAEMYAGCVSGAIQKQDYLEYIHLQGFSNVQVLKEKRIELPSDILSKYLSLEEIQNLEHQALGIYSITVRATK